MGDQPINLIRNNMVHLSRESVNNLQRWSNYPVYAETYVAWASDKERPT